MTYNRVVRVRAEARRLSIVPISLDWLRVWIGVRTVVELPSEQWLRRKALTGEMGQGIGKFPIGPACGYRGTEWQWDEDHTKTWSRAGFMTTTRRPSWIQVWWMAIRPRTLPAAMSGVAMGCALAWHDGVFQALPALAALIVALLLQIGSNVANDVFDFERGADTAERLGPLRVTQAGWLTPAEMKRGLWVIFGLAAMVGVYLAALRGWMLLVVGAVAILSALAYTGGPFPFGYYGLGDVFVFIFFGPVAVIGTYFVQAGAIRPSAVWMALPIGLIVTAILVVNNLRDMASDRAAGKYTLAVYLGERGTRLEYTVCLTVAYLVVPVAALMGVIPWAGMLSWLSLPLAIRSGQIVWRERGRPLNAALAGTGQTTLWFSLFFWLGMALDRFW